MKKQIRKSLMLLFTALVPFLLHCFSTEEKELVKKIKDKGKRYAIVVGINDYEDQNINKLQFARNDAKSLGKVLKDYGLFDQVFVMTDDLHPREALYPKKKNIIDQVQKVTSLANNEDTILFAFSGHGLNDAKKQSYLVAVDSDPTKRFESSVKVEDIFTHLKTFQRSLMFVDACREKFAAPGSKSLTDGAKGLQADSKVFTDAKVKAILFATAQEQLSYEDHPEGKNYGVFTRYILEGLEGKADKDADGIVSLMELKQYVESNVVAWSFRNDKSQKPFLKMEDETFGDLALSLNKKSVFEPVAGFFAPTEKKKDPSQEQKPKNQEVKPDVTEPKSFQYIPSVLDPLPKGVAKTYKNSLGMEFVLIPSGEYDMGCSKEDSDCYSDEKPAHRVKITKPFYMSKYEVTQAQWQKLMGNNPSAFVGANCNSPNGCDNHPVENVSWNDVQKFIEFLNKKEKKIYRLPTEAEWEYAARGGSTTKYYFGNDESVLGEYAWYTNNSDSKTHPVGQKKPNGFGLYDMSGNVYEWTGDWFDSSYYNKFENQLAIDPKGAETGSIRVLRGGSWYYRPQSVRSSHRNDWLPDYRNDFIGFRFVLSSL
jgi:formylglycine-generating enzyme required for sulfatase activity